MHCKGRDEWLQHHHIYRRNIQCLRWDIRNGLAVCHRCHFWWHNNPDAAMIWLDANMCTARTVLRLIAWTAKGRRPDRAAIRLALRAERDRLAPAERGRWAD